MADSFVVYRSFHEALKELSREQYGNVMFAINEYALNGDLPEDLTSIEKAIFLMAKPQLDANKQRRENGSMGGRPKKEIEKPMVSEIENQEKPMVIENAETEKPNVNVNENVNENVNAHTEGACVRESFKNFGKTQKDCWELIQNHNKTAPTERKIPCSSSFMSFIQKEMREILDATERSVEPEKITQALQNFIKVAKSDTWQKTFTWRSFCKNYQNFMPEYFTLQKYLNSEPETDDATQKPEYKFYMRMKDNTRFSIDLFQRHIEDWKTEGRPEGADYFKLQNEWEAQECL